jgi:hypothetical protein
MMDAAALILSLSAAKHRCVAEAATDADFILDLSAAFACTWARGRRPQPEW